MSMETRSAAALAVSAAFANACLGACAARALPVPSPSVAEAETFVPADLLPNDLDFLVRFDSRRVRNHATFAPLLLAAVASLPGFFSAVPAVIDRSKVIWVGGRWMPDGFRGDGIVALEGDPAIDPTGMPVALDPSFRPVPRPFGSNAVFERRSVPRDRAVLHVVLGTKGAVLATAAEADAVLRVLASHPDSDRLDPRAHGLVSFALRDPASAVVRWPAGLSYLSALMEDLEACTGSIDVSGSLQLESELVYSSEKSAQHARELAQAEGGRDRASFPELRSLLASAAWTQRGRTLAVRASVSFERFVSRP